MAGRNDEVMAAARVAGRRHAELARRIGRQEIALQHAVLDDIALLAGHAFAVERRTSHAVGDKRHFANLHQRRENFLAQAVEQKRRFAIEAAAGYCADKAADQARGDLCFKDHRAGARVEFAPIEPSHRAGAGNTAYGFGGIQIVGVARAGIPVVALHRALVFANDGH